MIFAYSVAGLILLPMVGAFLCAGLRKQDNTEAADFCLVLFPMAELALMLFCAVQFKDMELTVPICGLSFAMDGFRCVYGSVTAFMWASTALFSPEYFKSYQNRGRYDLFYLLTLTGTIGVFLSADLYTTFLFFELMSLCSYPWVAHDETPAAMRAADTYLAIAVIGGLVTLMGLFLFQNALGTLKIAELMDAAAAVENKSVLWAGSVCVLFGFGAKAGMFPMHIWLPKAHPVAPAPASALLSGILTKSGIFGILILSCQVMRYNADWGAMILILGTITMVWGAVLGVFSVDLKRTLACSSLSQVGFILVGVGMQVLLGEHGTLAAWGTMLHMINHSLIKLVLFLCAGVVYMNLHKLNLNEVRGFGRGKPLFHVLFLLGMLALCGFPGLGGYVSKTLLHESILEYTGSLTWVGWVEKLFLFSGGLTVAYMLKLYVCLFWSDPAPGQHEHKPYMNWYSAAALTAATAALTVIGVSPYGLMQKLAELGNSLMMAHHEAHVPEYFAWVNLKGGVISIAIGLVVYFFVVRPFLMKQEDGIMVYQDSFPKWFDLENLVYRPLLLKVLPGIIGPIFWFTANLPDMLIALVGRTLMFGDLLRFLTDLQDMIIWLFRRTIFQDANEEKPLNYTYFGYRLAAILMELDPYSAEEEVASDEMWEGANTPVSTFGRKVTSSMSFALLVASVGLCLSLVYMFFFVA